jgi:hypothetical protein
MDPVAVKSPVAGSYNSAVEKAVPELSVPPVISTFPVDKRVALSALRAVPIDPVGEKVPEVGS